MDLSRAPPASVLPIFIKGLYRLKLVRTFDLIATTIFIYDWMITLDLEIDLVWRSSWSFMKVLFLVQRYLPFVDTVALVLLLKFGSGMENEVCLAVYSASGYIMAAGVLVSELILTLRVWAVWHRDTRLSIFLPIFFGGLWIPIMYFLHVFVSTLQFAKLPQALLDIQDTQCFITKADSRFYLCWLLLMVVDAVTMSLMLIPGYKSYCAAGDSALFQTVYRNGTLYYLYLFAISTLNIVLVKVLPPGYENLLTPVERVVHSMLTSRVLLDIRSHSNRQNQEVASRWEGITELPMSPRLEPEKGFGTSSYKSIVIQRTQVTSQRAL